MIDIRVGDIIRAVSKDSPTEAIEGTVQKVELFEYSEDEGVIVGVTTLNHYLSTIRHDITVLERPVTLPTGEYAMVAHPTIKDYLPFVRIKGRWYMLAPDTGGMIRREESTVKYSVNMSGYEVVYEGVEK